MSVDRLSRRRALTGLSTVGLVSVVGCLGDSQQLTIGVGPSGSRSYQAGHALAVAADRHSDEISLRVESVESPSQRLYAVEDGTVTAAGVDNTTLYRASENRGVFDLDPLDDLPHQGFAFGHREHYWLALENGTVPDSAAEFDEQVVHPGQPSEPTRLITEQLLRDAGLWEAAEIDNRPRAELPAAAAEGTVGCLVAVQHSGRALSSGSQSLDEQVGDRLAVVPAGEAFQAAVEDAPNALDREIEPVGWEAAALAETVEGWTVPLQWLWSSTTDPDVVAELTRLAADYSETLREIDPLALDGDGERLAESVLDDVAVHEGTAEAFRTLGSWNSSWSVGDAAD